MYVTIYATPSAADYCIVCYFFILLLCLTRAVRGGVHGFKNSKVVYMSFEVRCFGFYIISGMT